MTWYCVARKDGMSAPPGSGNFCCLEFDSGLHRKKWLMACSPRAGPGQSWPAAVSFLPLRAPD